MKEFMKEFLQEAMEVFTRPLREFMDWIFFPKQADLCPQGVREPFDEEARRLRVAWSYFEN